MKAVVRTQMTQGLSSDDCGRAIAASLTIGVFPIIGFSTPLNAFFAAAFRLNQPITLMFNWIVGPIKIALILPFLRLGEWFFQAEPFSLSLMQFSERFFSDVAATTVEFAATFAYAICGWVACAPIIYLVLLNSARVLLKFDQFQRRDL